MYHYINLLLFQVNLEGGEGGHLTGGQCFVVAPCLVGFWDKFSCPTVDDIFVAP